MTLNEYVSACLDELTGFEQAVSCRASLLENDLSQEEWDRLLQSYREYLYRQNIIEHHET